MELGGLALSGWGMLEQIGSNQRNEAWTREQQANFEGILGDYFGKTEDLLGEGYASGMNFENQVYDDYRTANSNFTNRALDFSTTNYQDLLNMQIADSQGSMGLWN